MAPKLYGVPPSPPTRAVLMCAKALGLELEEVPVDLSNGVHLKDDFLKKNPQHTVPVLEDDDGFIVSDSHAIMAYLVAKYGKDDSLYPAKEYKQRATIDHRLYFDAGILAVRGLRITSRLFFHHIQPTQNDIDSLREAFQFLDQILANNGTDYVAGKNLSIADFSIITTVTSWGLFAPYTDFPNVTAYVERLEKLPCYEANKEGLLQFVDLFVSLTNKEFLDFPFLGVYKGYSRTGEGK